MRFWRISRFPASGRAFDGEGARLYPGRWNPPGVPVVYASSSLSLAALEILVHLDIRHARRPLFTFAVDVPPRLVETLDTAALPRGWDDLLHPEPAQALGGAWAASGRTLALRVPSIIIPGETNAVLNPAHRAFARLAIAGPRPFSLDPRLLERAVPRRPGRRTR